MKLGKSKLSVGGYGCFLCSIATLYQRSPVELLKVPGGINDEGLLTASVMAKYCGGECVGSRVQPPLGWCIAVTDKYAPQGYFTHFFCANPDKGQQIDPLDYPARIEPISYPITQYRLFYGIKLTGTWQDEAKKWAQETGVISGGWEDPTLPISQERVAAALQKLYSLLQSKP